MQVKMKRLHDREDRKPHRHKSQKRRIGRSEKRLNNQAALMEFTRGIRSPIGVHLFN